MAARLHLKLGLVPEHDRLRSSADTVLVNEPSVGSVMRSKGSLYAIVTAPGRNGHGRAASGLVADVLQRDYYYDESAGIPVCIAKALRDANRRLRTARESHGLPEGALGVAVAVIRGHELYVATVGDAEAFLVRAARLLTLPAQGRGPGMPAGGEARVDVWRGEIAAGDTLLLVGRNLARVVGTEELKNAVVTLHPQSAVEHLHHLFASGGDGSDAILAVEATELPSGRVERRLVPAAVSGPYGGPGARSLDEEMSVRGGAAAVIGTIGSGISSVREAIGDAIYGVAERVGSLLPQRGPRFRTLSPRAARREAQQRGVVALLAFLALVAMLGVGYYAFAAPLALRDRPVTSVSSAEAAFSAAQAILARYEANPSLPDDQALRVLRDAWTQLRAAERAGVPEAKLRPLREQARAGLDQRYAVRTTSPRAVYDLRTVSQQSDPGDIVRGPDGALYVLDRSIDSVVRIDVAERTGQVIVEPGQGPDPGVTTPLRLGLGGPDLLIFDVGGRLWRWRPAGDGADGTLGTLRLGGEPSWDDDVGDSDTFVRNADAGLYSLYVIVPDQRQILSYQPVADGSGFLPPTGYLIAAADVSGLLGLAIDGDIYTLSTDRVARYEAGRLTDFRLAVPPDDGDLRPGHDYRLLSLSGPRKSGRLYLWDAEHERILAFSKADGSFVAQFHPSAGVTPFQELRGMTVVERSRGRAPLLYWLSGTRLYATVLDEAAPGSASPAPSVSGSPGASASASPDASASAPSSGSAGP